VQTAPFLLAATSALLNDVEFDLRDAAFHHPKLAGGRTREIDNASGNVGTAVIDPDSHGLSGRYVRHPQLCAERQGRMSGGHCVRIEFLAARGRLVLRIEAGNTLRGDLCRARIVMPRERRMLSHMCDTPRGEVRCRSLVLPRRLPVRARNFGLSHRTGLSAGRKRRGGENDHRQSNDMSDTRVRTLDERMLGTIAGKHVVSPNRAPGPSPTRNEGRTVAERDQAPALSGDFIRGVLIEPQHAARATAAFWPRGISDQQSLRCAITPRQCGFASLRGA